MGRPPQGAFVGGAGLSGRFSRGRGRGLSIGVVLLMSTLGSLGIAAAAERIQIVDGGMIDAAEALRVARAAAPQQTVPLNQKVTFEGTEYFNSGPLPLDWTSDTVSLLVYQEPRPADGTIFNRLDTRRNERPNNNSASASFVLPGTDQPVASGSYVFDISGTVEAAEVTVMRRRGPQPTSGTLDLNLFVLDGSGLEGAALDQGMAFFAESYGQARIRLGTVTQYTVTGASGFLSVPRDTSVDSPLRQLATLSAQATNPAACNLFFVREIGDGDLFGISLGIPAALGIPGTISSGVVISVSAHQKADGFDVREFGQTSAHETGHGLGLYHTSEKDGSDHDPISDTPECAGADPLEAAACPDGDNLMFWSGRDFKVSAGQGYVLLRSPVVK